MFDVASFVAARAKVQGAVYRASEYKPKLLVGSRAASNENYILLGIACSRPVLAAQLLALWP